jgi:polar amino acid transport system substrate-binding protein
MKKIIYICLFFLLATSVVLGQNNLKVSLPLMPPAIINANEGVFVDLIKAMKEDYKDGTIEIIGVYPFARSVENVISGTADIHIPITKSLTDSLEKINYMESTVSIFTVPWVLYVNKDVKGLNANTVSKYKICTQRGNNLFLDLKVQEVNDIETGLKIVSAGRLDAFIFGMPPADMALKNSGIKNIRRIYYKNLPSVFLLQKSERGKEVDKILTKIIKSLKDKGIYQKIMRPPFILEKYEDWQVQ